MPDASYDFIASMREKVERTVAISEYLEQLAERLDARGAAGDHVRAADLRDLARMNEQLLDIAVEMIGAGVLREHLEGRAE